MDDERAQRFEAELRSLFPQWLRAAEFRQGRVPLLIKNHGVVGAVKHLLHKPGASNGFVRLRDAGRLDLTLEYLVLKREYGGLFSAEERGIARRRLVEHGMRRDQLPLEPYLAIPPGRTVLTRPSDRPCRARLGGSRRFAKRDVRAGPAREEIHDIERDIIEFGLVRAKDLEGAKHLVTRGPAGERVLDDRTEPQHELVM